MGALLANRASVDETVDEAVAKAVAAERRLAADKADVAARIADDRLKDEVARLSGVFDRALETEQRDRMKLVEEVKQGVVEANWKEDHIAQLEEKLEDALCLAEEQEEEQVPDAAARWHRCLARLPRRRQTTDSRGGRNIYSSEDNELIMRLTKHCGTAKSTQEALRVVLTHVFGGDAVEGVDWESPSESMIWERGKALGCVNDQLSSIVLSQADEWLAVGNDGTKINGVDCQSAWVETGEGTRLNFLAVLPDGTARGCNDCLLETVSRTGGSLGMLVDELDRRGLDTTAFPKVDGVDIGKIMSSMADGCNTALKSTKNLMESVLQRRKEVFIGNDNSEEEWSALPDDSPEKLFVRVGCFNHQRVLVSAEFARREVKADNAFLQNVNTDNAPLRSTELSLSSIFRSLAKLFGAHKQVDAYVLGDSGCFFALLEEEHGSELFADWGRGELGSRHDWILVFAFGCYYNIPLLAGYLEQSLFGDASIMRDACYVRMSSSYMQAKILVAAVRFDKLDRPFRALVNLDVIKLSPANLSVVFEHILRVMELQLISEEAVMMFYDEKYRLFEGVEGLEEKVSEHLVDWENHELEKTRRSIDGQTSLEAMKLQRASIYGAVSSADWPSMKGIVIEQTRLWAESTLASYRSNCSEYLEPDGELCRSKQTASLRALLLRLGCTNDNSEQPFAVAKAIKKKAPTMSAQALLGRAAAATMGTFAIQPAPRKYTETKNSSKRKKADDEAEANPLRLDNVLGGEETKRAIVDVAIRRAAKGASVEQAMALGAGASVSSIHAAADNKAHKKVMCVRRAAVAESKKQRLENLLEQQHTLLQEEVYTYNPSELCLDVSPTAAGEMMKKQLKLVASMGWTAVLKSHDPLLDLTLGQTKKSHSGVAELKDALLDTLKAVAAAARTLNLEVSDELQVGTGALHRKVYMFGDEVDRRRRFVEESERTVAETVAKVTAPDPKFADLERNLDGKRFHDGKDYVIERIATSREYDSIVAECRPVGSDGNAKLKSRSVYYGVESEDDFNEMMEMIRVYDERAAIAAIKSAKVAELKAKRAAVDEAPRPKRATRRR